MHVVLGGHITPARCARAHRVEHTHVTNWCFSRFGTDTITHLVSRWIDGSPTDHLLSDDLRNMYNESDRAAGFRFLRKRFPELVHAAAFYYGEPPRIWYDRRTIPVWVWRGDDSKVHTILREPDTPPPSADARPDHLRSWRGGCQGCGFAPILTVGAYHETLSDIQRDHPDVRITALADDTYLSAPPAHLYPCYDAKRREAERVNTAVLLRRSPPGPAHHPTPGQRVRRAVAGRTQAPRAPCQLGP